MSVTWRDLRRARLILAVSFAGCSLVALTSAAAAHAESLSPWWGVTSGALPTYMHTGTGTNEIVELNIIGTEGFYALYEETPPSGHGFTNKNSVAVIDLPNVTAAKLQEVLETEVLPGRRLSVSGGPEAGGAKYLITFPDEAVAGLRVQGFSGVEGSVSEVQRGSSDGEIVVSAENLGDAAANGEVSPVVVADTPPAGWEVNGIEAFGTTNTSDEEVPLVCSVKRLTCDYKGTVLPGKVIVERLFVSWHGAVSGEENRATVSGGGAFASRSVMGPVQIGIGEAPFGVEDYGLEAEEPGGAPDTQAGSHPFQLTTTLALNENAEDKPAGAMAKDLHFNLPPGVIGNPTPFEECTAKEFTNGTDIGPVCPLGSIVGIASSTILLPTPEGEYRFETPTSPIYSMVPSAGEPARFAFHVELVPVYLDTSVLTGNGYGVQVSVDNLSQTADFLGSRVTFWGVPGDPRHNGQRGFGEAPSPEANPHPFLSLPTSCTGPVQSTFTADSWNDPGKFLAPVQLNEPMAELDGCNHLPFSPELSVAPDVSAASTPSGLTVGVHIPQTATLNPTGLAESTLKGTTVTLPEGIAVNPGGADGLEVCSESQIGYLADESTPESLRFTPEEGEPFCPDGSKIGTVEVETPLLPNTLKGAIYLGSPAPFGEPGLNPFGTLLAMYIVARDPVSGVLLKLPGDVALDPSSGRLVATFQDTPPLPFENLRLHFFGGARGPLATPAKCGSYETQASLEPWSGEAPSLATSSFQISSGPSGSECQSPLPFSPALTAGTTSIQAGGFSPFTMTMSRPDGSQTLSSLQLHMPDGLSGALQNVSLCPEPQADEGTCGPESLVGETTVSVGVGGNPYTVRGGKVFITGPYHGAPFGLSILTPAKAGPFNLGNVVVRAKIEVDPLTAALTITSNPPGTEYSIPTILHGIPLEIQHLNVTINRPEFTFNPTDCEKKSITATLLSTEDASDQLSVPFQATNCAVLGFKPGFAVSTSGKTSRANGASLNVKLTYPTDVPGYQTNLAKVKVELPKQLPSRLTTLQKACTEKVFEANPASCPAASRIGEVVATTPILTTGLSGPAYFVSNGSAKFPELVVALKGEDGVEVDLHGETFISKAGITSSTFNSIPDVPVGSFDLKLPEGPDSALAANGALCGTKLIMPTEFVAQNGAVIRQNTTISVNECKKAIRVVRHKAKGKKATITVQVPSAGKLLATGAGVSSAIASAGQAGTVTVTLGLSNNEQHFLASHPGRQLRVAINLLFHPHNGSKLSSSVMVLLS